MKKKVLLVGETCINTVICTKGFDSFSSSYLEEEFHFIKEAVEAAGYEFFNIGCQDVDKKFPSSIKELEQYSCIIFSDVGSNSFLLGNDTYLRGRKCVDKLALVRDYVLNGGAFIMVGGYLSFSGFEGKAGYSRCAIQDILPVECSNSDDRREHPEGICPKTVYEHVSLKNMPAQWEAVLGYNKTKLKDGCIMPVTIDDDPYVAYGEFGKGKSAVITSDCCPHWAPVEFLQWEGYKAMWQGMLEYLTN